MSILSINKSIVKTIFSDCTKCVLKTNICAQCKNMDRYITSSFSITCNSSIILAPALYEEYFHGGPVAFFTVVAGYLAIIELIIAICTPNSGYLKTNPSWIEETLTMRTLAQHLLKITPSLDDAFHSRDQLVVISTLEEWIVYGISVMNYVSSKKTEEHSVIFYRLKQSLLSKCVIQWTFGPRALRDKLEEKIQIDERWNNQHEKLMKKHELKTLHQELISKHIELNQVKFVIE